MVFVARAFLNPPMSCRVDDEKGPQVFKIDPAGHVLGYKATAAGTKEQVRNNYMGGYSCDYRQV
jgi:20S proteasome subunit alpha 1